MQQVNFLFTDVRAKESFLNNNSFMYILYSWYKTIVLICMKTHAAFNAGADPECLF